MPTRIHELLTKLSIKSLFYQGNFIPVNSPGLCFLETLDSELYKYHISSSTIEMGAALCSNNSEKSTLLKMFKGSPLHILKLPLC